ncbi:hypothetical protein PHMEG_00016504 [Phytophthora megakarya]|uniref:Uncharacterized protein n=1 Tax=Phytophthora megakarya TaxID=4795 RepID=A0A225W0S2_9STRA|nr:hypothetical protein PHMEG_00016504 [Phytophthora megakarya]
MKRGEGSRLKRARVNTEQDDDSAGSMSDEEWEALEKQLETTTTVIIFTMTELSVEVNGCRVALSNLRRDILEKCSDNSVQLEDDESTIRTNTRKTEVGKTKTTTYL